MHRAAPKDDYGSAEYEAELECGTLPSRERRTSLSMCSEILLHGYDNTESFLCQATIIVLRSLLATVYYESEVVLSLGSGDAKTRRLELPVTPRVPARSTRVRVRRG